MAVPSLSHCSVSALPVAAAVNVAVLPWPTVWFVGSRVITGGTSVRSTSMALNVTAAAKFWLDTRQRK